MKAAVFHGPKKITYETVDDPILKHDRDAILKVTSTAICGSDLHIYTGGLLILPCFSAVSEAGFKHISIVTGGGPHSVTKEEFTWVKTMIGNVKNAITGTYHAINPRHLPRYLAEFCYRHNRRFQLDNMLPRFAYIAVRTPPMPGRLLKLAEAYG